ncbi:uncharacterized protein ARMOST_12369 [Armillaria ostoyae]|uniref:Uncharacterized protein n=1 Tax=Armillaria ostoyae TaxID=47428 RepID=A0A284RJR5_ARMOS|nr:uncharacterized protein ARMOST_12369 [Armillaria ostoyae]
MDLARALEMDGRLKLLVLGELATEREALLGEFVAVDRKVPSSIGGRYSWVMLMSARPGNGDGTTTSLSPVKLLSYPQPHPIILERLPAARRPMD